MGRSAIQTLYGFSAMQVVNDGQYAEFRDVVHASGLDLQTPDRAMRDTHQAFLR